MANVYDQAIFGGKLVPFKEANVSIASSAVLYGLSVYTVFHVAKTDKSLLAFRLQDHFKRLQDSAKIIGIDPPAEHWSYEQFYELVQKLLTANVVTKNVFVRASIHVDALLPGTRSRGLPTVLSMFVYDADPIVPRSGARLKTSLWRRIPDISIPSRAKVNGAYVNSVLARQDAMDSGYDDCIFLDAAGHVCELSAANIFMVRNGVLYTPDTHSDLLEGINRRSVLQMATDIGMQVVERSIDLTELYIADEIFICGTSAFLTAVLEVDARIVATGSGPITAKLQAIHEAALLGTSNTYKKWVTKIA